MNKYSLLFFSLILILSCSSNKSNEALVNTQFGKVRGISENGVNIWYSVPYGKVSRWSAPENPDSWSNEYDASEWKGLALQLKGNEVVGTEDCLNLDIYSKSGSTNLPDKGWGSVGGPGSLRTEDRHLPVQYTQDRKRRLYFLNRSHYHGKTDFKEIDLINCPCGDSCCFIMQP